MAIRLNKEQRKTARIFNRRATRFGATRMEREALIEAGLVEANLMNPAGGDRDSVGSLQERSHYGSVQRRLNRAKAADRFLREARAIRRRGFKGSSGQLAQAVQRSAYPGRYEQRDDEAEAILARYAGRSSNSRDRASAARFEERRQTEQSTIDTTLERRALASQYFAQRGRPGALAQLGMGLSQLDAASAGPTPARAPSRSGRGSEAGRRAKNGLRGGEDSQIVQLSRLAHEMGLTTTSGKRGTRGTASGGVSDHYAGNTSANARDWSGSPAAMRRTARALARRLGVKYRPGVTNVVRNGYRYQLIHETNVGGNHYDHVHLGIKRVGKR